MIARLESTLDERLAERSERIFQDDLNQTQRQTDRLFAVLMLIQWIGGIVLAFVISPRTWVGAQDSVHIHVWAAILLGALFMGPGIGLAWISPGKTLTRHVIAAGQMLDSALLIHFTGGRLETHFHEIGRASCRERV